MSPPPLSSDDLQALYVAIRPELYALLLRRSGSPDVAADMVQDVFLRLGSIRTALPDREQARAYMFRIAANMAIDRARNEARRSNILQGIGVLFETAVPDPETLAVDRDQVRRVDLALDELPDHCRQVLMLARVHGLSHKEIADRLALSVSSVEKYQLRALRHCRARLDGASVA